MVVVTFPVLLPLLLMQVVVVVLVIVVLSAPDAPVLQLFTMVDAPSGWLDATWPPICGGGRMTGGGGPIELR